MIELRKVDLENIQEIITLSVSESQKSLIASNIESIVEAYATTASGYTALPFGIYSDHDLVGFVMFGYGKIEDDEPIISQGNYLIWRFMIDQRYQGQGLGKEALKVCLEYLETKPCGNANYCWLSYEPENFVAKALYSSVGFKENGEMCGNEVVSVLKI